MTATATRLSSFSRDGSFAADKEKDANSMLLDLEKGLRSLKTGEQCEAIVRFPRLFEKYPFPIVINGALLKLADVFRVGSNFLRLCILRVTQQSEKHLDKIINIDEFVRRIYSVIHSNDAVARALTLRVLGSIARIIPERKNVHHSIVSGLDSNDAVELEAAINAASSFAEESKSFASGICDKIADMVESPATPVNMKLKLMPLFQHIYHDFAVTRKVRSLCSRLIKKYPSRGFVMITLHTLSCLASNSLVDIPEQIELLCNYLVDDTRMPLKLMALQDMKLLARKGPHMWSTHMIDKLLEFVMNTPYEGLQNGGLTVLITLSGDVGIIHFVYDSDSLVRQCCSRFCYHSNIKLASKSSQLLSHLAIQAKLADNTSTINELSLEAATALETFILVLKRISDKKSREAIKGALKAIVDLCSAYPELADRFIDTIITSLPQVNEELAVLFCECLSAISSFHNDLLVNLVSEIVEILRECEEKHKLILPLITILFQACVNEGIPEDLMVDLRNITTQGDCWVSYRIARQATRYGHHDLAAHIFKHLTTKVSSEHYNFWLSALKEACQGECYFKYDEPATVTQFVQRVAKAEVHFHNSIAALKAAATPTSLLIFQTEYINLYTQTLQAYTQVVRACCSFQTCPPPAIATSLAVTTGDDLHRCDHVIAQMQKCIERLGALCEKYRQLYNSSFDADPCSLVNVHIHEQSCQVMIRVLKTVLLHSKRKGEAVEVETSGFELSSRNVVLENKQLVTVCTDILENLKTLYGSHSDVPISHKHISFIQNTAMTLCQVPLHFPRYFYQSVQATEIKLSLSPQPRAGDTVSVHYDTHLVLKVEGVVQHTAHREIFRKVTKISILTSSLMQSRGKMVVESKLPEPPKNELVETASPHNDFFTGQFLLTFPIAGIHVVTVKTSVVDSDGIEWSTGPKMTVSVKSYDEAVQRQQQQQYAAQRQQQRAAAAAAHQY